MHATLWLVWPSLLWAVVDDLRRREIPDSASGLLIGIAILGCLWPDPLGWTERGLGFLTGFGIGAGAFYAGLWGGGDAKLLTGIGTVVGWSGTLSVMMYTLILGGVVSAIAARRGAESIAYAPVLALGFGVWQLLTAVAPSFFGMLPTPWS